MRVKRSRVALWLDGLLHWNYRRHEECRTLLTWLEARTGDRIVDIGCGDGYYNALMHRDGAQVTGVDIGERQIASARKRYATGGLDFRLGAAESLTYESGAYNKAVSFCVMEHLDDDEAVMRHLHRALKPGGMLFFSADSLSNEGLHEHERRRHRQRYAVNTFYTSDLVREKLQRCGFRMLNHHYILSDPRSLALVRFSWRLDRMPSWLVPLKTAGYMVLIGLTQLISALGGFPNRGHSEHAGLTLMVRAVKES